jgi:hypothetical protein
MWIIVDSVKYVPSSERSFLTIYVSWNKVPTHMMRIFISSQHDTCHLALTDLVMSTIHQWPPQMTSWTGIVVVLLQAATDLPFFRSSSSDCQPPLKHLNTAAHPTHGLVPMGCADPVISLWDSTSQSYIKLNVCLLFRLWCRSAHSSVNNNMTLVLSVLPVHWLSLHRFLSMSSLNIWACSDMKIHTCTLSFNSCWKISWTFCSVSHISVPMSQLWKIPHFLDFVIPHIDTAVFSKCRLVGF